MRPRRLRFPLLAAVLPCILLGCRATQPPYLEGPMLRSKKPLAGKIGGTSEVVQVAHAEPAAPPLPDVALAFLPQSRATPLAALAFPPSPAIRPRGPLTFSSQDHSPRSPAEKLPVPLTAVPASRPKTSAPVSAGFAVRRRVPGVFGRAPDYRWLQGVLEKDDRGRLFLRYDDAGAADGGKGKVLLEDDSRLARFREKDVLFVEGEWKPAPAADSSSSSEKPWPRYRVHSVQLVERKPADI